MKFVYRLPLFLVLIFASRLHAQSVLVHYWNFNSLATAYHNPDIPAFKADFSAIDTNAATINYVLTPSAPGTYSGYVDNVDGDTSSNRANAHLGALGGQAYRVRNPSSPDSMSLEWHIPSTGFKNLSLKWALQASSTNSGQTEEDFDYSVDGGKNWKSSAITVNGASSNKLDVTQAQYQIPSFGLVTVTFGNDNAVNDNPNLIFRVKFGGPNVAIAKGNNRFDDISLEGELASSGSTGGTITLATPTSGDTLASGSTVNISFNTTGTVTDTRTIEFSADNGANWSNVTTLNVASAYQWTVPNTPTSNAKLRVKDGAGVTGTSGSFVIVAPGSVKSVTVAGGAQVSGGTNVDITWSAQGFLGKTVSVDVSYDDQATWKAIVSSYDFSSSWSYSWKVPKPAQAKAIIRLTFASGASATSAPFSIEGAPNASVADVQPARPAIWPNPCRDQITIANPSGGSVQISVFDVLGREVIRENMTGANPLLDLHSIPVGSYLVQFVCNSLHETFSFVKQ